MKRTRSDSTAAAVEMACVSDDVPLPDGVILRDEAEMVVWRQLTRARAFLDWRECDLLLVAKAARLEGDIRKHQMMLDKTGAIIKNPRGTPIANPLFSIVDTLQRQQLAVMRSLSLMQTETDPRTKNAVGLKHAGMRSDIEALDDLIAR